MKWIRWWGRKGRVEGGKGMRGEGEGRGGKEEGDKGQIVCRERVKKKVETVLWFRL